MFETQHKMYLLLFYVIKIASCTGSSFIIIVNASNITSKKIWNPWTTLNAGDYTKQWLNEKTMNNTNPTITQQYPFLKRQKFSSSTGGCYKGYKSCKTTFDLLQNPSDSNSPYNFSQLHIAINNVIGQGLKPYLTTGFIPIAYSQNATLSAETDLNQDPPSSYDLYGEYIYNFALSLKQKYAENELKDWLFIVFTEYNNYRHFNDSQNINNTE
eukprot:201964_1